MAATGFQHGPLGDLRVLELGTLLAGPFCGQLLGDLGAEVIKIEPPGQGDPMRVWGRQKAGEPSLWWPVIARNKKAITLDLRQAEGQALLLELAAKADFLLENLPSRHAREMVPMTVSVKLLPPSAALLGLIVVTRGVRSI